LAPIALLTNRALAFGSNGRTLDMNIGLAGRQDDVNWSATGYWIINDGAGANQRSGSA
jgi:hypothetical protein